MIFYGADFSGAKDPSGRICYARGELVSGKIIINELVQCDDRLDLFAAIDSSACTGITMNPSGFICQRHCRI